MHFSVSLSIIRSSICMYGYCVLFDNSAWKSRGRWSLNTLSRLASTTLICLALNSTSRISYNYLVRSLSSCDMVNISACVAGFIVKSDNIPQCIIVALSPARRRNSSRKCVAGVSHSRWRTSNPPRIVSSPSMISAAHSAPTESMQHQNIGTSKSVEFLEAMRYKYIVYMFNAIVPLRRFHQRFTTLLQHLLEDAIGAINLNILRFDFPVNPLNVFSGDLGLLGILGWILERLLSLTHERLKINLRVLQIVVILRIALLHSTTLLMVGSVTFIHLGYLVHLLDQVLSMVRFTIFLILHLIRYLLGEFGEERILQRWNHLWMLHVRERRNQLLQLLQISCTSMIIMPTMDL